MEKRKFTTEELSDYGFHFVANIGKPDSNGISVQLWTDGQENILYDPVTREIFRYPPFV